MALLSGSLRDLTNARPMDVSIVDNNGDQITSLTATPAPSTSTLTSVASANVDTLLLAANASRRKFHIYNDSSKTLKVALDSTASATSFTFVIGPNAYYESEIGDYTGAIHGIWNAANGFARITELT